MPLPRREIDVTYELDQPLDTFLLHKIVDHVKYDRLREFALSRLMTGELDYESIIAKESSPSKKVQAVLDLWFQQVAQVSNYDVRRFVWNVMSWQQMDSLESSVFDEVAVHIFPQLLPKTGNRIVELDIDRTNFTVIYEEGTKLTGHTSNFLRDIAPFTESIEPEDVRLAGNFFVQSTRSKGESSALQKLKMTSCNCSQDFWRKLFLHLSICKKLTHLIVSRNSLGEAGDYLAHSIWLWGSDPPLQVLQLDQCLMPENTWRELFESLRGCKHITHLDLSYNRLGEAASELGRSISRWGDQSPLQKLDLSYCSMSAKACDDLFSPLTRCRCLSYLDVSCNMVGEASHDLVGAWRPLETFIAEHCFIPTAVWPFLLRSLSACSKLKFLDLSNNN